MRPLRAETSVGLARAGGDSDGVETARRRRPTGADRRSNLRVPRHDASTHPAAQQAPCSGNSREVLAKVLGGVARSS